MFEAIVVVVTWRRTWSGARSDVLLGNFKTSFTAAIFREGTVYFVVIESCNTLLLISSVVQKTAVVFIFRALTAAPPVLISRFYFYMDDVQNAEMTVPALPTMSPLAQAQLATLQFAHERDSLDDDVQEARSGSRD
ncbi:hypothetical protein C8Q79DRAFT_1009227 [Trametes meyenii]|nr:hypothetical protein C8Q79DRAFT_1009227 [Trametes meyenii]